MDHAITIGDLVWCGLAVGGVCLVFGVIMAVISAYGSWMSR